MQTAAEKQVVSHKHICPVCLKIWAHKADSCVISQFIGRILGRIGMACCPKCITSVEGLQ